MPWVVKKCMMFLWRSQFSFLHEKIRNISCHSITQSCPSRNLDYSTCSNSCPLSRWCHPTISSSVTPFSFCPQSFPASGSFPVSQLFASGGQSIGASASGSVLSMNIQGWFPLALTGLISLQSKGLSRVFSNTTSQNHPFFGAQPAYGLTLTSIHDYGKHRSFDCALPL